MVDQASFSNCQSDIGIPINFEEESGFVTFWKFEIRVPLEVSRDVRYVSRWGGQLGLSLGSARGIHTSLHLLQWKTRLHSSHCREIWPSFESRHHRIHSTWGSKLRFLLTLLLLREEFSWCSCGKVTYHFNRIMGIPCLLEMIWRPWSFPRVPVMKLVFL